MTQNELIINNIRQWNIPLPNQRYEVLIHCSTYNHERYIESALNGFVMQKTSFPFCAIIIDDCSTDRTPDIILKYAKEYPDIIKPILLGENHMQHGKPRDPYFIEWHKSCKYMAQCEGDDYWMEPMKLQRQYDFMELHPEYSLCFHNAIISFDNQNKPASIFNSIGEDREIKMEELLDKWVCPTPSLFIRMSVLPAFPVNGKIISGDWRTVLHCAASGKVWGMKAVMACYRKTESTTSMSNTYAHRSDDTFLKKVSILEGLDEYTEGRYHELISKYIRFYAVFGDLIQFKKKHGMLATILLRPHSIIEIVWKRTIRPRLDKNAPTFSS